MKKIFDFHADDFALTEHVIFAIQNIQEEKEQEIRNRLLLKKTADEANRANHGLRR